ncbi:MAG: hypothetical protein WA982_02460 [Rubrobacteraceae bacterium]
MTVISRLLGWFVDFLREMDRGLAVMRGEEPVAGYRPGADWSRRGVGCTVSDRRGDRSKSGR